MYQMVSQLMVPRDILQVLDGLSVIVPRGVLYVPDGLSWVMVLRGILHVPNGHSGDVAYGYSPCT